MFSKNMKKDLTALGITLVLAVIAGVMGWAGIIGALTIGSAVFYGVIILLVAFLYSLVHPGDDNFVSVALFTLTAILLFVVVLGAATALNWGILLA